MVDPELQNWQSSLSAKQLGAHTTKPATEFSKAFGDTKYMENGNSGFTRVYRGTLDKPWDPSPDGREYRMPELTRQLGQHWTSTKHVADTFARHSGNEGYAGQGRVFTGLVHNKDIFYHNDPGSLEHFDQYAIWHPASEWAGEEDEGENPENEITIRSGSPVVLNKIDTHTATTPSPDPNDRFSSQVRPKYAEKSVKLKPGTIGKVGKF
jgi:hypothetical protein